MKSQDKQAGLLVVDYGSQYTLLITRKLRELGIYCETAAPGAKRPEHFEALGVILSGGPGAATQASSPDLPTWLMDSRLPVLGICYGFHLLTRYFGGELRQSELREYGAAEIVVEGSGAGCLFTGTPARQTVWMSHGDDASQLPASLECLARTEHGGIAAFRHRERGVFGLQFHPEVKHSRYGLTLLENFAYQACGLDGLWEGPQILAQARAEVREQAGETGRVLLGVSGGVDSAVLACLVTEALGADRVTAVLVDHGMMRWREADWVREHLATAGIDLQVMRAQDVFLSALSGVCDPEVKRKIIGTQFIRCFESFAREHGPFDFLGQGTLYPDVVESGGHGEGSHTIKSHHNVGGLPERLHLRLLEPFRYLFKDEVRAIGRQLAVPSALVERHPFPGPGLGVRIPGEVTADKVEILQQADDIFVKELLAAKLYHQVWQAAAILLPVRSVGVMGDKRTYEWTCVLRAVNAVDGMTAEVAPLSHEFLTQTATKIVNQVQGINRVLYDVTSKPPATIEWE